MHAPSLTMLPWYDGTCMTHRKLKPTRDESMQLVVWTKHGTSTCQATIIVFFRVHHICDTKNF